MAGDRDKTFKRVVKAAAATKLPGIEQGVSYRSPALKVAGKFLARLYDADTLVLRCSLEDKELLFQTAPKIYFETDHYKGWPALLMRLGKADDAELRDGIARAWRLQAPKKLRGGVGGAGLILALVLGAVPAIAGMGGGAGAGGAAMGGGTMSHYSLPPDALEVPPTDKDDTQSAHRQQTQASGLDTIKGNTPPQNKPTK